MKFSNSYPKSNISSVPHVTQAQTQACSDRWWRNQLASTSGDMVQRQAEWTMKAAEAGLCRQWKLHRQGFANNAGQGMAAM